MPLKPLRSIRQNLVLYDRLELPSTDYKTVILPRELIEHKIGAVDGNRTRLNLIDNQVLFPENYYGINWLPRYGSNIRHSG